MTLGRALAVVLAFDGLVLAIMLIAGFVGPRSDAAGEGLRHAYTVFVAIPFVLAGVLALVPFAPVRWLALGIASLLPLVVVVALVSPLLTPIAERLSATGASEFPRAPARQMAAAIASGDSDAVRRIATAQHVDFAAEGREQRTLLTFAVDRRPALIPLLVQLGADANRPSPNGEVPLEAAIAASQASAPAPGNTDAMRLLLEAGANPNVRSRFGTWLLELTVRNRRPDQVALLLDHGADPKTIGDRGWTMPMFAVMARQWELAADLLRRGASATQHGTYGDSLGGVYDESVRPIAAELTAADRARIDAFREVARSAGVALPAIDPR